MKYARRLGALVAAGSVAKLLKSRLQSGNRWAGTADGGMLEDDSPTPAPHALTQLQERPTFDMDERGRSFAMSDDLDDRAHSKTADNAPLRLEEPRVE